LRVENFSVLHFTFYSFIFFGFFLGPPHPVAEKAPGWDRAIQDCASLRYPDEKVGTRFVPQLLTIARAEEGESICYFFSIFGKRITIDGA